MEKKKKDSTIKQKQTSADKKISFFFRDKYDNPTYYKRIKFSEIISSYSEWSKNWIVTHNIVQNLINHKQLPNFKKVCSDEGTLKGDIKPALDDCEPSDDEFCNEK